MTRQIKLVVSLVVLALLLGACRKEARPIPVAAPRAMAALAAPAAAMMPRMRAAEAPDSRIAYTQNFVIELPNEAVPPAVQSAAEAAVAAGGTVLNTRVDRLADGSVQGGLSVRLPPDHYQAFAGGLLAPPARLVSHAENAEDKTIASLDIDKRLAAQTALRERLTQLLQKAGGSVSDLVTIEKQLADVQGAIESLTAQRDYLRTITDTIRVDVSYNGLIQQAGPVDLSPLRAALDDFVAAMVASAGDVITWIAVALPWLPLAALGLWLLRAVLQRR